MYGRFSVGSMVGVLVVATSLATARYSVREEHLAIPIGGRSLVLKSDECRCCYQAQDPPFWHRFYSENDKHNDLCPLPREPAVTPSALLSAASARAILGLFDVASGSGVEPFAEEVDPAVVFPSPNGEKRSMTILSLSSPFGELASCNSETQSCHSASAPNTTHSGFHTTPEWNECSSHSDCEDLDQIVVALTSLDRGNYSAVAELYVRHPDFLFINQSRQLLQIVNCNRTGFIGQVPIHLGKMADAIAVAAR